MDEKNLILPQPGVDGQWGDVASVYGPCTCPCGQPTSYFKGLENTSDGICWPQTQALRVKALHPDRWLTWLLSNPSLLEKTDRLGWNAQTVVWHLIGLESVPIDWLTPNDLAMVEFLKQQLNMSTREVE